MLNFVLMNIVVHAGSLESMSSDVAALGGSAPSIALLSDSSILCPSIYDPIWYEYHDILVRGFQAEKSKEDPCSWISS